MSTFLLRVEAIESRIASYSCPRGASGRVHSLRLRRCFTKSTFRKQEALRLDIPFPREHDLPKQTIFEQSPDYDNRNGSNRRAVDKDSSGELEQDRRDGLAEVPEAKGIHIRGRREKSHKLSYDRYLLRKRLATWELGDVPPDVQGIGAVPNDAIEEEKKLHAALQRGDPQVVLKALIAYTKLDDFDSTSTLLEWIPPTMFSEILRCIDPIHFIKRYQNLYRAVSPARAYALGITKIVDEDGYYKFCTRFLDYAIDILN